MAYMGGLHYWWPKITGRLISRKDGLKFGCADHLCWFQPDFSSRNSFWGYPGMPRQLRHLCAGVPGAKRNVHGGRHHFRSGLFNPVDLPRVGMEEGQDIAAEPMACDRNLEWQVAPTPPPVFNFNWQPVVTAGPYGYDGAPWNWGTKPH